MRRARALDPKARGRVRHHRLTRTAASVTLLAAATVPTLTALTAVPAHAVPSPVGDDYSLSTTVSPAPMTAGDCSGDTACVAAPAPVGGGADDQPALAAAVTAAAGHAVPAVMDGETVVTPAQPGTVYLAAGTYTLARPLALPPNVRLRGSGITATTLLLAPGSWQNFGYSFLVRPNGATSAGSTNLVSDLTLNGSCRVGAGAPEQSVAPNKTCNLGAPASYGGGLKAGDRWTVRQVRFTNLNYFRLWIAGTRDVQALDNRFDSWGGAGASDNDNIGGGANASGTLIEHNQFDETIRGNSIDLTNASDTTIRYNTVHATPYYLTFRNVSDYGSIYLEGVTDSTVTENVLYGSHLVLQSNSRYAHTGNNEHITNPRATTVTGNEFHDSFATGITVTYDDYVDTDGTPHILRAGGANVISGNTINRPTHSGILVVGCNEEAKDAADTITGNTVTNAGTGGSTSFATGCGTFDTAGIGLSAGTGDRIWGNTVTDDQAAPTTWYGVHVGARNGKTEPGDTSLTDPSGQTPANSATGVVGGLYRHAANAPDPATALVGVRAGGAATLTWKEAYPLAGRPVGGYRVYRDGVAVATLPVGSATIPGNLLTDDQSSLENGITGWTAGARTAVSADTTAGAVGTASLRLTATAKGQISAAGPVVAVTPGTNYTAVASYQAGNTGRRVRTGMAWIDAQGAVISRVSSGNAATVDSTTGWMTSSYSKVAPSNAVAAQVLVYADSNAIGEVHLVDRIGLVAGTSTETWSDPAPPAGPAVYQIVAYRGDDGENSAVAVVTV